jgi:hypothetical protein
MACTKNIYKYETKNIYQIYEMIENKTGNQAALMSIAEKAYIVALTFAGLVTPTWISGYLNDEMQVDSLCELSLKANVLHKDDPYIFSVSHSAWLMRMRTTKLSLKKYVLSTDWVVNELYDVFVLLQEQCMKYPSLALTN